MGTKKEKILNKIFINALVAYALGDIATVIGPLVDSAIIANYLGVEAVAAIGLFSPFLMFIVQISPGFEIPWLAFPSTAAWPLRHAQVLLRC